MKASRSKNCHWLARLLCLLVHLACPAKRRKKNWKCWERKSAAACQKKPITWWQVPKQAASWTRHMNWEWQFWMNSSSWRYWKAYEKNHQSSVPRCRHGQSIPAGHQSQPERNDAHRGQAADPVCGGRGGGGGYHRYGVHHRTQQACD